MHNSLFKAILLAGGHHLSRSEGIPLLAFPLVIIQFFNKLVQQFQSACQFRDLLFLATYCLIEHPLMVLFELSELLAILHLLMAEQSVSFLHLLLESGGVLLLDFAALFSRELGGQHFDFLLELPVEFLFGFHFN